MQALRVLYVTDRWDGPYRYRCQQAALQLRAEGAVANVAHLGDAALEGAIARYGVVVLFRLPWSEQVERVVAQARHAGVPLLFDIDDLTFDPTFASLMPFRSRYSADEWANAYGRQMVGLRRTLDACDAFIGSTPELAVHARALGKPAHVHPNVVPGVYLRRGRFGPRLRRALGVGPTVGYFSGSDTHDEDFSSIAPALEHVLAEHPAVRLLIVGYLDLAGRHPELDRRTVRLPYMHWRDFAFAYAACHVTLAPLATINAFTNSKSALKFFEAGAFSVPTIASPVSEMARSIRHGITGFLPQSELGWVESIRSALDPETSTRMGIEARTAVLEEHSAEAHRGRLRGILERYAVTGAGSEPLSSPLEMPDENGPSLGRRLVRPGVSFRDVLRIVRVARQSVRPAMAFAEFEHLLDGVAEGDGARDAMTAAGVRIVRANAMPAWWASPDVSHAAALPGELRSSASDPHLVSPALRIDPSRYRYFAVRLRTAAPSASARAQVFWKSGDPAAFTEENSATFSITPDGIDRTHVVDLTLEPWRRAWLRAGRITHLRIDPLDRPGSFVLGAALLVPDATNLPERAPSVADADDAVDLDAAGPDELAMIVRAGEMGERVRVTARGPQERGRARLAEWLDGKGLTVERLSMDADGRLMAVLCTDGAAAANGVDIVVPVYNARELVLRCIESVARHASGDHRLVIVDDASTDVTLVRELEEFQAQHERVVLLRNPTNLGFVGTANRGIRNAEGRDVLLLNSDTEVFAGFLDGLRACAASDPRAGLVSPLSNNATICGVPDFCRDNALPDRMTRTEMAALVARSSERLRPELVTPHGFCLYLRADLLARVGAFDEAHFGRGFGEENDLGERAKALGWKTLLADDVYVWHEGKGSFGEEGRALEQRHADVLGRLHPGYHPAVARFVEQNPLAPVHANVHRHLARRSHSVEPAPLFILHANPFAGEPGGVEYCVRDLTKALRLPRAVLTYPTGDALEVTEIVDGKLGNPRGYRFPLGHPPSRFCHEHPEAVSALTEILELFRVGWVHVHHLMFLPLAVGRLLASRRLPYVVTVHDFYPACPSFNLLDVTSNTACCPRSCGDPAATARCQRALFEKLGEPLSADPTAFVGRHREEFRALLAGAERVLFPSASAERVTGAVLGLPKHAEVLPHGYDGYVAPARTADRKGRLRVALVGQISYAAKGAEAYLRTMALASSANIEWHLFGRTDLFGLDARLDALGSKATIVRHGGYDRDTIVHRLATARVDVGLLLPAWPETFSYTLSELLAARLPVIARRIGALADRLEGAPFAVLVDGAEEAARELERLAGDRSALAEMSARVVAPGGTEEWAARHRALYSLAARASPVQGAVATTERQYRRLNEVAMTTKVVTRAATVTEPAPAVTSAWWFRYLERAKPYAPETLRQIVRRRLSRDGAVTVRRFRLPGPAATLGQQLTLDRRYVGTAQLTSHGTDPSILLTTGTFDPKTIQLVRFNLWCSTRMAVHAQLYWRQEGAATFDEAHSITVALDGFPSDWREYVVRLGASDRAGAWYDGGPIVALRFDPINVPGPIGLGEFALCSDGR